MSARRAEGAGWGAAPSTQPTEGGALTALDYLVRMAQGHDYADPMKIMDAEDDVRDALAARSQRPEAVADRDALGRQVREVWVSWAREQENPKATWLVGWDDLPEPDREVDRRIGYALFTAGREAVLSEQARHRFLTEPVVRPQRPEGVTVTEWRVRHRLSAATYPATADDRWGPQYVKQSCTITKFPDVVTEWAEVSGDTETAGDHPHATHPNHWARHGHPGRPCLPDGSCYGATPAPEAGEGA